MKRLNIIIAVFLFTIATILLVGIPMQVNLDKGQWAILACIVLLGYLEAYLYFDNYVNFVIKEQRQDIAKAWREGHDHAMKEINAG